MSPPPARHIVSFSLFAARRRASSSSPAFASRYSEYAFDATPIFSILMSALRRFSIERLPSRRYSMPPPDIFLMSAVRCRAWLLHIIDYALSSRSSR
jgi:hypothetical protein